ncbi:MAG TPA: preprotein translocase subunit SecY, partial [Ilumatobacteraceae bacterium]|nr:preprotein translocase subunit SecY [Ilumatobacteraceae bacterium]
MPVLSSVKNVFKVADLRNKILFVLLIVALYRFGVAIQVPGVDQHAVEQLRDSAEGGGALGFLNLFSGGA